MAKRKRSSDDKTIAKRLKEGRGQGRGSDYKPYLRIQDVPSRGLVTRVKGWKTGRLHHFLSKLELTLFYLLEWSKLVIDIREQFPLGLEETIAIAQKLGISHPTDKRTKKPVIMTTDFIVTTTDSVELLDQARTVKYVTELSSTRVMEKFEIERVYWASRNIDWGIVTERDIDPVLASNIKWFHTYRDAANLSPLTQDLIHRIEEILTPRIVQDALPLREITNSCDALLGLPSGICLMAVRYLLANRKWQVDMKKRIHPSERLLISVASSK